MILSQYLVNIQVKRQHEEDIKEINQNMIVRVKASKDIKRLTDERNAAMQVRHFKKKKINPSLNIVEKFYFCLTFLSFSNL